MDKPTLRKEIPLIIEKLEKSKNSLYSKRSTLEPTLYLLDLICLTPDGFANLPDDEQKRIVDAINKRFSENLIESMIDNINNIQVSEGWKNEPAKETLDDIHEICENFEVIEIEDIVGIIDDMIASLNEAVAIL